MSLQEFFAMGGYAQFVWPAYLVTLGLLVINVVTARGSHRRALQDAKRRSQPPENRR